MKAADKICEVARSYLGQKEISGNKGFQDDWFEKKMVERGFVSGDAWCALFLELILYEAYKDTIFEDYINRSCSKGAVQTWRNFKKDGPFPCNRTPVVGAGVIWQYYKNAVATWQGHAGIVIAVDKTGFKAIEGNGNACGGREGIEVVLKQRTLAVPDTGLRVLGFIHPANLEI